LSRIPVIGFAAFSGTGKTTLLKQLIPLLKAHEINVALIKHAHHDFDIDTPGKDSYELRKAGADQVLIASDRRMALITEKRETSDPELEDLVSRIDAQDLDLILVEGFRHLRFSKIELHRPILEKPLLCREDSSIIAFATDAPLKQPPQLPQLDLNNPDEIANFIQQWLLSQSVTE